MSTPERIEELLADRALWGLSDDERRELENGMAELGITREDSSWDVTAAAVTAALIEPIAEPAPKSLLRMVKGEAAAFFVRERGVELVAIGGGGLADPASARATFGSTTVARPESARRGRLGWFVAVAAMAMAAWFLWERVRPAPSAEVQRQALLDYGADLLQLDWNAGPSPRSGKASGDVVWDQATQRGYMRLRGLPPNDAEEFQYQLWIFDGERDAAHPVDGGVFDVPTGRGEVVVPIEAKILVKNAQAFAVTIETPGGVVVSKREHIVTTAGL